MPSRSQFIVYRMCTPFIESALNFWRYINMAICKKCGSEIPEGANVCPSCGEPASVSAQAQNIAQNFMDTADSTAEFDQSDIEQNKVMCIFAYIWFLFLIPLLAAPNSKFARFHANQGLVLFLANVALGVVFGILMFIFAFIPFAGWAINSILGLILSAFSLVFMILGIVNAANGKAKELPLIGKIIIIK